MLTQLRSEDIFTIRNQFRKEQRENKKDNISIFKDIKKSFGCLSEEVMPTIYKDRDNRKHLVFLNEGETLDIISLRKFYFSLYVNFTESQCRDINDLICQKSCLKCSSSEEGFENAEVSLLTVVSVLKCCVIDMDELSIMSSLCYWLYSITTK